MNNLVDFDDLSIHILNGLDPAHSKLSHALQVWETPLDFEELFEKLMNYEAQLKLMNPCLLSQLYLLWHLLSRPGHNNTNILISTTSQAHIINPTI